MGWANFARCDPGACAPGFMLPPALQVQRPRINRARQLLRETKKSVIEVALDPSHFAQIFRRETGLTPSEYRRQR